MTVVVGVDGAGRSHRLAALAVASGTPTVRVTPNDSPDDLRARLDAARTDGSLVIADDAHRLGEDSLRLLAGVARDGATVAISRRPTIDSPWLAELEEAVVAAGGDIVHLSPLTAAEIAALVGRVTSKQPTPERAEEIRTASAGLPAVATAIATAPVAPATAAPHGAMAAAPLDAVPPALVARVQGRLAMAGATATRLARVLMLDIDVPDRVLSDASGVSGDELPAMIRLLRDSGLLVPDTDRMVPAAAAAVRADLSQAELRRVHRDMAHALVASGIDPVLAASQLRAARSVGEPAVADVYAAAGERLRFTDPEAALAWLDDAAEAGAAPAAVVAPRAEAAALLGHPLGDTAVAARNVRLAMVTGAVQAHHGRAERAAAALLDAGDAGPAVAVPSLVSIGRREEATEIVRTSDADTALLRLAEAATAAVEPHLAVPRFIEAAEAAERDPPPVVLPDTPHALGAVVAVAAGDVGTAERLLAGAMETAVGGPVAAERHRLLLAWARMRAGRYDTALAELRRPVDQLLTGRERLLRACLAAGIARRSGDVATLRDVWIQAEPNLARRAVDLFQLECVEELVVAAARLGRPHRAAGVIEDLQRIVDRLGRPVSWSAALGWLRLQAAVALDDAAGTERAAAALPAVGEPATRPSAQHRAAACWVDVLAGRVDRDAVLAAADALDHAELPWEGSRLAGQAAIRTTDSDDARRLLERARAFGHDRSDAPPSAQSGPLSDREIEIARLVLAGRTHREIGAQLYISPKTVEHHAARIRTKLGARTRAEFVAALQKLLNGPS